MLKIEQCKLAYQCQKTWDELERTEKNEQRYCSSCKETVHFIQTDKEYQEAQSKEWCIAYDTSNGLAERNIVLGNMEPTKFDNPRGNQAYLDIEGFLKDKEN